MIRSNSSPPSQRLPETPPGMLEFLLFCRRQWRPMLGWAAAGVFIACLYLVFMPGLFQSDAVVYVRPKNSQMTQFNGQSLEIAPMLEDELATHLEVLQSEHVIQQALSISGMDQASSIQGAIETDETPTEYVQRKLIVAKGGDGGSRLARVLKVRLRHCDAGDCQTILQEVIKRYQGFLREDRTSEMEDALTYWRTKRDKLHVAAKAAEDAFHHFYMQAPLLLRQPTSANTHLDEVTSLETKLTDLRVAWSDIQAKLAAMRMETLDDHAPAEDYLKRFGLIDQSALKPLELIVSVHREGMHPHRQGLADASAELLRYRLRERELKARYGKDHPQVKHVLDGIAHIQSVIAKSQQGPGASLDPQLVVRAYITSLKGQLAAIRTQALALRRRRDAAVQRAKEVIQVHTEYERLRADLDHSRQLVVAADEQMEATRTARDYNGFVTKVIQSPRLGQQVSPHPLLSLSIGALLGIAAGACWGLLHDQRQCDSVLAGPASAPAVPGERSRPSKATLRA